jgi:hypothetical protein
MQVHLAVDEEQPLLGRKAEGRTFTTGRVAGAIAAVCGVVGLAALKRTSAGAPLLGAAKSADPFNDVLQRQSSQFEELAASRQEGIKMMAELQVYAFVHPEGISNLGASEYQTCVAPNSAPKNGYKKTDVGAIREDLVFATDLFTTERNNAQPVTDFANSAAAVTSISCKAPPAIKFSDTKACAEDRGFCDNNCYMPVPDNCAEGKKNFGSCSPTVGSVCASITDVSDGCNTISEEINAERAKYTAMDPGASPCADTPGTPYKIASEKQAEYQTALNMWAGAVNDATEVCTVGHGLLVHNEGMYDRHYAVMKEITADLKELCDQSDGANKFDFAAAVAEAQKNSIPTVRRRKLVWWQQLCEPTLASLEQITDSLEIASPQLQCFAEKCTEKKATEANAFEALKAAHNGYVSAFNTYKTKADAFNGYVDTKEEQKAGVIAKLESFHAGKQATSKIYARDKASFDRFDSGADAGHCGLTSCQVKTVCHAHIKDYFASFINPDTCQAVPMTVDQVCKGTTRVEDADAAKAAAEKAAAEKAAAEAAANINYIQFKYRGQRHSNANINNGNCVSIGMFKNRWGRFAGCDADSCMLNNPTDLSLQTCDNNNDWQVWGMEDTGNGMLFHIKADPSRCMYISTEPANKNTYKIITLAACDKSDGRQLFKQESYGGSSIWRNVATSNALDSISYGNGVGNGVLAGFGSNNAKKFDAISA